MVDCGHPALEETIMTMACKTLQYVMLWLQTVGASGHWQETRKSKGFGGMFSDVFVMCFTTRFNNLCFMWMGLFQWPASPDQTEHNWSRNLPILNFNKMMMMMMKSDVMEWNEECMQSTWLWPWRRKILWWRSWRTDTLKSLTKTLRCSLLSYQTSMMMNSQPIYVTLLIPCKSLLGLA